MIFFLKVEDVYEEVSVHLVLLTPNNVHLVSIVNKTN